MAEFHYEAYTQQGQRVAGTEKADTEQDLELRLKSRGLLPKNISRRASLNFRLSLNKKIEPHDFLMFVGELRSLLDSGMGIPQAISILSDSDEKSLLSTELGKVYQLIKSGASMSSACAASPHIFEPFFISTLRTGEQSGNLVRPLQSYYNFLERRIELRRNIIQALTYPIFLLITFTIILVLMFIFVVPNFTNLYDGLSTEMPALTLWLLSTVKHFHYVLLAVLLILLVGLFSIRKIKSSVTGRIWLDKLKGELPLYGASYLLHGYWQFAQSLASLLRGGGNLVFALKTASEISTNNYLLAQLNHVINRVENGESLAYALGEETKIPKRAIKMIMVGEESSNLEIMLETVANYFEFQLDDKLKRLISLIEPIIMLAIGLIVGTVIIALYLPIFGMVNVLG